MLFVPLLANIKPFSHISSCINSSVQHGHFILVRHFNYTSWPEHGVPESCSTLIKFVKAVRAHRHNNTTIVVHCRYRGVSVVVYEHCINNSKVLEVKCTLLCFWWQNRVLSTKSISHCSSVLVWAEQVCSSLSTTLFSTSEITTLWIFMAWWLNYAASGCAWYRIWWVQFKYNNVIYSCDWISKPRENKQTKKDYLQYVVLSCSSTLKNHQRLKNGGLVVLLKKESCPAVIPSPPGNI